MVTLILHCPTVEARRCCVTGMLPLDSSVPQHTTGGGLCCWGSEQKDVPAVVGGDSAGVSPGPLLYGLFESVCFGHPRGATYPRGQRGGRNRPCRALEQYPAPTTRPFCAHDIVVFQVSGDATPACLLLFLYRYNLDRAILLK
jgi:hypothetical protein